MIEVENLSKCFGRVQAINNISFRVEKGKIWGFLGPNGAGKTTTMRILAGYLTPGSGTARLNGKDVLAEPGRVKRMMGYLPEIVPVYPELTVREYLRFVAEISGVEKRNLNRAVSRAVERTRLEAVFPRLVKNISRGYRQRLGIAQAIIHEPDILILDEPTMGLDPAQIIEIREMIRSLRESATVILSSHLLPEINQVCDGAVVIKEGELKAMVSREEWSKNLEIQVLFEEKFDRDDFLSRFPGIQVLKVSWNSLMIEFKNRVDDINPILTYLIRCKVKIREVKTGLEGLYMNIISKDISGTSPGRRSA